MVVIFTPVGTPAVCSYTTFGYQLFFGILTYRNLCSFLRRVSRVERQLTRMLLLQLIALTLASIPYAIFYFYAAVTRRLTKISLRLAQENLFMTIIDQQRLYHQ
jgi:hypothetical protein